MPTSSWSFSARHCASRIPTVCEQWWYLLWGINKYLCACVHFCDLYDNYILYIFIYIPSSYVELSCVESIIYCWSCAMRLAIWSWSTLSWEAAVCFICASSAETPFGSFREMYWPSPTFISTLADTFSVNSLPRRAFLQTVAMTVPGSVAARGDPFCEL